jgi:hypothetical protein
MRTMRLRPRDAAMWEEPTLDHLINNACYHVTVILGGWARRANSPATGRASNGQERRPTVRIKKAKDT